MSKRIFPALMYTRSFGWALFLVMGWTAFHGIDVLHGAAWVACVAFWGLGGSFLFADLLRGKDFLKEPTPPPPPAARRYRYRAYLVVHINIRQSPPVATFVGIYSTSASDLTNTGGEAHADLYSLEAENYHQASEELERVATLYFPWVGPLMRRYQ